MAKTAELVLQLVDRVTGPSRAVTGALSGVNRALNSVTGTYRSATRAAGAVAPLSLPIMLGADQIGRQVFEFEKVGNALEAVTDMTGEQRRQIEDLAQELNILFPATNSEILGAALELGKSGASFEQILGSLENVLNLALAADFGIPESSAVLVSTLTAMRLPMETALEAAESTAKVSDMLAFAANASLADIPDLATSLKYVTAAAAATGLELNEVGAILAVFANNGIMGSNAGTGLRYGLLQLINPSKAASDALAKLNIDIGDYVSGAQRIAAPDLVTNLGFDGIDITGLGLEKQMQAILDDPAISRSPAKLVAALSPLIGDALGNGLLDDKALAQSLSDSLTVLGTQVDMMGLMTAFRDNPQSEALFGQIFGKQHAVKWMALLAGDLDGMAQDFAGHSAGAAERMSAKRMQGVVGQWYAMTAAVENFAIVLSGTGLLEDASAGIVRITDALERVSAISPDLLRMGTHTALAVGAMAPLGWILSGVGSVAALAVNPIVLVGGALAALATLNWDNFKAFGSSFVASFQDRLDPAVIEQAAGAAEKLTTAFSGIGQGQGWAAWGAGAGDALGSFVNGVPAFVDKLEALGDKALPILERLAPAGEAVAGAIGSIVSAVGRTAAGFGAGVVSFVDGFISYLDASTVDSIVRFAQAIGSLISGIADNLASSDRIDLLVRSLQGFGELTADGIDTVVGWLTALADGLTALSQMDAQTIGANLMNGFVAGLTQGLNPLQNIVNTVQRLQAALTNGQYGNYNAGIPGAPPGARVGPAATSHPSGLPVPDAVSGGTVPSIPQFANGGEHDRGWMITGEKGPELRYATSPGHVISNQDVHDALNGRGNSSGMIQNNTFHVTGSNADEITRKISGILGRQLERSRGLSMTDRPVTEY